MMKTLLLAGVTLFGLSGVAVAANVAAFSQTSQTNTATATVNGADTQTTLSVNDAALSIGQFLGNPVLPPALFSLTATSIDAATTVLTAVIQHYSGSFCITSAAGCTGTNILSGVFTDAAFGGLGGPGLAVNVNNPPDTLTLSSSILSAADLAAPNALTIGFTNLQPALAIVGETIAPFTASLAGTVSASVVEVPEPMGVALMGVGLLGLGLVRARSR
jgi:hypothetical protein